MSATAQEREIIAKILEYSESGGTDMLPEIMHNPVSNYTDPDQLDKEINILFRQFPIIVGHASELAEAGDFLTHNDLGVPILVTRNSDNNINAFLNVCRHRGARVEGRECGKARTFACPYHSWTYDLNGKLRGLPHPTGFDGIDKSALGLVELAAFVRFGMIWVVPSTQEKEVDIDAWLEPMAEQLGSLDIDDHVIFRKWSVNRNMSWRFALEGFQESYHFCHAHRDTACSSYLDNQSVHMQRYPHVRHAVPLTKVSELKDIDQKDWEYRPYFMTQNYLFPANFIQVMTDHIYVHTIIPTGPGTCVFQCMMLIAEAPQTDKAERYWKKNYEIIRTVFNEDFEIGENIQKGIDSGANQSFIFGKNECTLHYGQNTLEDALTGRLSV